MPYKEVARAQGIKYPSLVERLAAELQREARAGEIDPDKAPLILLERTSGGPPTLHVFVVWNDQTWADLDRQERGDIIVDAMESARPDDAPKVTIAMGLTAAEADRMKINYK